MGALKLNRGNKELLAFLGKNGKLHIKLVWHWKAFTSNTKIQTVQFKFSFKKNSTVFSCLRKGETDFFSTSPRAWSTIFWTWSRERGAPGWKTWTLVKLDHNLSVSGIILPELHFVWKTQDVFFLILEKRPDKTRLSLSREQMEGGVCSSEGWMPRGDWTLGRRRPVVVKFLFWF